MVEIGSFIELDFPKGKELYNGKTNIARLNTGRAAIWHSFRLTGASAIWVPYYQCECVREFLLSKNCVVKYYYQDDSFNPINLTPNPDEAVLLVNYFGIMSFNKMTDLASRYNNVIIDNCQAFFSPPIPSVFNVYSARKFFGVPDGAYVLGPCAERFQEEYSQGYSSDTADFLLTRIEYGCEGKAYKSRILNEERLDKEDIKNMSLLTHKILDGVDYDNNQEKRKENFKLACTLFNEINQLDISQYFDDAVVPMVYPLVIEDESILKRLIAAKHFQGRWWKYITESLPNTTFENWMSRYMIPITIDQRYGASEIRFIHSVITSNL